ncbi:MAG TPA: tRNA (adenosine(37)-N6)-threonylcarbamoyltransferase complex dimerization subunit type 1 TsaB [Gammaproteobacteria bacterium]|nr:tRNA (adenosine(37)-N6)-threonylcarbamoyltransferase complex dimerization subunit type 1 TsaB [Gammaproteobacteria bacterium]
MNMLAFDTSSLACSVALLREPEFNNNLLHRIAPRQQAHLLLPMIRELMTDAVLSYQQLDALAFGCGPGSFTGIRIAASAAQAIGLVANCPIVPVSSLAAAAQAAYLDKQWMKLLVAQDARMGQIYWALYQIDAQGLAVAVHGDQLCKIEEIALPARVENYYAIGDAWEAYAEQLIARVECEPVEVDSKQCPTGLAIGKLAQVKLAKGEWVTPAGALASYLGGKR